ncbi:unnamed protein product [Lactuca virosa]|uniref:Uncharacterized protein n=1 Tax=Lactuca virosa TaxID=75947 RepID=A0AAU9ML64_9ASTR|nr:unnamed protein product [Lactuca virosa]
MEQTSPKKILTKDEHLRQPEKGMLKLFGTIVYHTNRGSKKSLILKVVKVQKVKECRGFADDAIDLDIHSESSNGEENVTGGSPITYLLKTFCFNKNGD